MARTNQRFWKGLQMKSELSHDDKRLGFQLQLDALLAEYKMVRDEVAYFRQMQGQLDTLALTATGLSIPLILAILQQSRDSIGVILLIPIIFFVIAFIQLRQERVIVVDSIYVDSHTRPKVNALLSELSASKTSLLAFEDMHSANYIAPVLLFSLFFTTSRGGISLSIGAGLIAVCLYIQFEILKLNWNTYETWILLIDLLLMIGYFIYGFLIARITHRFRTKTEKV